MNHSFSKKLVSIFTSREFILAALLVVASVIVSFFSPVFLSSANILSVIIAITVNGVIAVGMVMLLACGEMDLSVGKNMAFTGVIVAKLIVSGVPVAVAIVLSLLVAVFIGAFNGFFVSKIGLNAFITTLGMSCCIEGVMLVMANGRSITGLSESFKMLGQGKLAGIQYPIFVMILLVVVADLLLRNSRQLRKIYFAGSNAKAAKLNGISVTRVKLYTFVFTGFCAGLAGVMFASRLGSASVTVGGSTALDVITACIIGGASLNGGKGTVLGAVLGALFLAVLSTALNLLSVNIYWQNFATGAILILAILLDALSEKRKSVGKAVL
ncbi:MAG: ABC transporter permease [Eubacteriales bacterium]|nr:ABC transporter permease [Eubacteriales bacterium]